MSNSGPSNLVEKLKQIAEKRNNLQADIELRYLEEATSIATDTRSAKRQKTTAKDAVKIPGLNKTLGESLLDLIPFKEKQSKKDIYFDYLSKNMIIDLTDASSESQLRWFSVDVANKIKEKYIIKKPEFKDNNIYCLLKKLNKAKTPNSLSRFLNELESFKSNDLKIKSVKRIYEHILVIHTERNWLLSKESRSHLTEFDYQVKFWGPIFESFFSSDSTVLHWGDTMSTPCKKNKLKFRLDLRLLIFNDEEIIADGMTGEVARMASKGKLYGDRLKSVLATKCHLNNLLSTISCLDANTAKSISVPVVQIMGLNTHVFVLKLVNRGIYTLQEVCSFRFPVATNSLKDNLKEIVDGLSLIESLVLEIRQVYQTYQLPHDDHMARIVNEERRLKKFSPSKWTTDVIWNPDVAEEKDGEEEEEENEDDEDEDGEDDEEDDE